MHYLTFDLCIKVTRNIAKHPLHHWGRHLQGLKLLRPTVKEQMNLQANAVFDLDLGCCPVPSTSCDLCTRKVWRYSIQRFRSCIYMKIDIWPWPWVQGHMKCKPTPSTSCRICSCNSWSCYVLRFGGCIFKKIQYLTFIVSPSILYSMWFMQLQSLKLVRVWMGRGGVWYSLFIKNLAHYSSH